MDLAAYEPEREHATELLPRDVALEEGKGLLSIFHQTIT